MIHAYGRDLAVLAATLSKCHLAVPLLDTSAQTLAGLVLWSGDAANSAHHAWLWATARTCSDLAGFKLLSGCDQHCVARRQFARPDPNTNTGHLQRKTP